jgi:hypothetical protein
LTLSPKFANDIAYDLFTGPELKSPRVFSVWRPLLFPGALSGIGERDGKQAPNGRRGLYQSRFVQWVQRICRLRLASSPFGAASQLGEYQ